MPMQYPDVAIPDGEIPRATFPFAQHMLDTYASESNKVASVWGRFEDADLPYRPHPKSSSIAAILKHQLLSERRFFGEFLGTPEPPADEVPPTAETVAAYRQRFLALARPRLDAIAPQPEAWWLESVPFFDVTRPRVWVFWRRVLHTAHHRTQLTVYLRLLDRPVPATYGPTADETWQGADPTQSTAAASRK
jgi:uncharacterized damage-inducible protein DinB